MLINSEWVSGTAAAPAQGYRRVQIKGRAHAAVAEVHEVDAHSTCVAHVERIIRIDRMTGNCPVIIAHPHPVIISYCCTIIIS